MLQCRLLAVVAFSVDRTSFARKLLVIPGTRCSNVWVIYVDSSRAAESIGFSSESTPTPESVFRPHGGAAVMSGVGRYQQRCQSRNHSLGSQFFPIPIWELVGISLIFRELVGT